MGCLRIQCVKHVFALTLTAQFTPLRIAGVSDWLPHTLSDHPKPASDYHLKTGQRE